MNYPDDFINKIICGDCSEVMKDIPDNSIDLIFTDPPYSKKYQYTFQYLSDYCPRIMKVGSSLITIVGHYELEYVMNLFRGKLKYRWILCLNQFTRNHARMAMGIEVMWKPMLWYVKEKCRNYGFCMDGIKIDAIEGLKKPLHKWQQPVQWCEYYIEKLTKPEEVVLDPFCGSGTVAIACKNLNRKFIGIDISQEYCDLANERLAE